MKPVEQLTNEELRVEIAEFCGYRWCHNYNGRLRVLADKDTYKFLAHTYKDFSMELPIDWEITLRCIPCYPTDLNAMWEVEEKLHLEQQRSYVAYLWKANPNARVDAWKWNQDMLNHTIWWTLNHVTAKQRAIAFVKTIREIK